MTATLGLVAGSGRLPFEVAAAAASQGTQVAIAAIENNTDPAIESLAGGAFTWLAGGELDRLINFFTQAGATEIILAGAVATPEMMNDGVPMRAPAVYSPASRAAGTTRSCAAAPRRSSPRACRWRIRPSTWAIA